MSRPRRGGSCPLQQQPAGPVSARRNLSGGRHRFRFAQDAGRAGPESGTGLGRQVPLRQGRAVGGSVHLRGLLHVRKAGPEREVHLPRSRRPLPGLDPGPQSWVASRPGRGICGATGPHLGLSARSEPSKCPRPLRFIERGGLQNLWPLLRLRTVYRVGRPWPSGASAAFVLPGERGHRHPRRPHTQPRPHPLPDRLLPRPRPGTLRKHGFRLLRTRALPPGRW